MLMPMKNIANIQSTELFDQLTRIQGHTNWSFTVWNINPGYRNHVMMKYSKYERLAR